MDIEFLRNIGHRLLKEVSNYKPQFNKTSLGYGASGDITYPIDKMAEDIIIESLEKAGFDINYITEERGIKKIDGNSITVIIDPIDGSKNAISGVPFFSSSIAVADGNELKNLKLGYIINLVNGDEFWAKRGEGAFFNGEKIKVEEKGKSIIVAFEASNPHEAIKKIFPLFKIASRVRCFGSTALDLAYLSKGALSIFITPFPSRIFDFSAGILIAKESKALITDLNGNSIEELPIVFETKTTLLVSLSESLHKRSLELINLK
ncbi:MAG: inositol monophosphatase family protein [Thermodesulfovibrio sp.]|nr:hypothetical protein [Thermodesulfovibrio sp.]MDW7999219.1 inositol monophosphatase family protein [Thermodesulfovibrio sp.]